MIRPQPLDWRCRCGEEIFSLLAKDSFSSSSSLSSSLPFQTVVEREGASQRSSGNIRVGLVCGSTRTRTCLSTYTGVRMASRQRASDLPAAKPPPGADRSAGESEKRTKKKKKPLVCWPSLSVCPPSTTPRLWEKGKMSIHISLSICLFPDLYLYSTTMYLSIYLPLPVCLSV